MAQYIVLEGGEKDEWTRVVVHTNIPGSGPNSENAVLVKWRDAIVGLAPRFKEPLGTTSVVPIAFLPSGRQAQLDTGELWESEFRMDDSAKLDPVARQTNIETAVLEHSSAELDRLKKILNYYGKVGSV